MKTRPAIFILFLLCSSISVAWQIPTQVPNTPEIEHMQINIWPEYDRPSVLVMFQIRFNQETPLPATIVIHIPSGVGKPYSVAMREQDGMLYNLDYSLTQEQGQQRLEFKTLSPEVQIEYYDSSITKDGFKRNFSYQWKTEYIIHSLSVNVQQPSDSQNMVIVPGMGDGRKEQDGLTYFTLLTNELLPGSLINIHINYEKSENTLSAIQQPVQPVQPINEQTLGRATIISALPWTLAALGGILLLGGMLWFWISGRRDFVHTNRGIDDKKSVLDEENSDYKEIKIYCHRCGQRSRGGDVFCRHCGTRLKLD
jgi:hypothetical protein